MQQAFAFIPSDLRARALSLAYLRREGRIDASGARVDSQDRYLTEALQSLDFVGKRAVQIGCNNARELLSLAALGIRPAAGIDQSSGFLAQARQLAEATGVVPRLIEADVYDLPDDLASRKSSRTRRQSRMRGDSH